MGSVLQWEWTSECILLKGKTSDPFLLWVVWQWFQGEGFYFFPLDWKLMECALFLSSHRSLPVVYVLVGIILPNASFCSHINQHYLFDDNTNLAFLFDLVVVVALVHIFVLSLPLCHMATHSYRC